MLIPNSSPVRPQPAIFAAADGSRDAAAADDAVAVALELGELAGELQHQAVDAGVGDQQVRPEPTTSTAMPSARRPASSSTSSRLGSRPGEQLGRAAGAHRGQPRERVVALDPGRKRSRLLHQRLGELVDVAGADRHQQVAVAEPRRASARSAVATSRSQSTGRPPAWSAAARATSRPLTPASSPTGCSRAA